MALRDGVILGTAKFGPNRPARGSHVATASFMVASASRGSGVGRAMCEYVIAAAKARGYAAMQFNAVVSTNAYAIELYRQLGFVTIGTVPAAFDHAGWDALDSTSCTCCSDRAVRRHQHGPE